MSERVALCPCADYDEAHLTDALRTVIQETDGFFSLKAGMKVALKVNLVAALAPDRAATVHPAFLRVLCRLLTGRGLSVVIGDSPGGLYTVSALERVYRVCGLTALEGEGVSLNRDVSIREISYPAGTVLHTFTCTSWVLDCDAVINVCKLKSHGMMGLSCAAKNLFGIIPGVTKPEYHFRFPQYEQFAAMILDLDSFLSPCLHLCDAVMAMEGNGPTAGTPRHVGAVIASRCPHSLDLLAASLVSLKTEDVPTLALAHARGIIPNTAEALAVSGDPAPLRLDDFKVAATHAGLLFEGDGKSRMKRLISRIARRALTSKPRVTKKTCVGCRKCADICPAHAIDMKGGKPSIRRADCIRCFCCQEFCPVGAMRVSRPLVARMLTPSPKDVKKE